MIGTLFGTVGTAALWGLVVALSFTGWGSWLKRRLVPALEVDLGLRAAWGVALSVAVGGALCLLGLARRPVLYLWIGGGVALGGGEFLAWARRSPELLRRPWSLVPRRWDTPLLIGLLLVAGFLYLGACAPSFPNPSDDWLAYLPFIKMIQQTGTFVDPFNVRRMASYGGQSYLQALVQLVVPDAQMSVFDQGLCLLLLIALVLGIAREAPKVSRLAFLLLTLFILMLAEVRVNSASEMSGALGFVALYRTIVFVERNGVGGLRGALLVALPAALVATLRQNYIVVVVIMLGAMVLSRAGEDEGLRDRLRQLGRVAGVVAVCLLPWAVLAFRSNHTFLFPVFSGNYDPNYAGITAPSSWDARLKFYLAAAFYEEPVRTMPLLLLAAPAVARGPHRRALLGLWAGLLIGFALLALSLPDADNFTIARYDFAFVVAFALATALAAAELLTTAGRALDRLVLGAVLVAFALHIQGAPGAAVRNLNVALDRLRTSDRPSPLAVRVEDVHRMQQMVPAGERLLVMFERPYLLDYARNRIVHLDQPGAASPPPRLPLGQGGEKMAEYLLGQGIRYFAFVLPDRSESEIYSRAHWRKQLGARMRIWRNTAPLFLQAFDAIDQLAQTRRRLHDDGHWVVVDLAVRAG